MRRALAAGASAALAAAVAVGAPSAAASPGGASDAGGPVVVVTGLNNPRQLTWDGGSDGALVIAEAGRGGDDCTAVGEGEEVFELCVGLTGAVSRVARPRRTEGAEPHRVLEDLVSYAGPDGSFAGGPSGADVDANGVVIAAQAQAPTGGDGAPLPLTAPGVDQFAHLVLGLGEDGAPAPYVDFAAAEAELNPDGAQIESNPYAALVVGRRGHESVLVADAAANAIWRVTPDLDADPGEDGLPPYDLSVFYSWPTLPDDEEFPEYVPTSLAKDRHGNVYVGGLGSEQPGQARVTKLSPEGDLVEDYPGFTGITGVAVDHRGRYLYVSQLFGSTPLLPPGDQPSDEAPPTDGVPGDVVRVDLETGTYATEPVPLPAGVAADRRGGVYVVAWSVSDEDGTEASDEVPGLEPGQVWRIGFDGDEVPLPVTGSPYLPEDTGGAFVPAPADFYEYATAEACGTTLFFLPGAVRELEYRATVQDDGTVVIDTRGASTVDVRAQDGRRVDEVDASGPIRTEIGAAFSFSLGGPTYFFAQPGEEDAVDAAGLPLAFTFTEGTLTASFTEAGVEITERPEEVTDLCEQLA